MIGIWTTDEYELVSLIHSLTSIMTNVKFILLKKCFTNVTSPSTTLEIITYVTVKLHDDGFIYGLFKMRVNVCT